LRSPLATWFCFASVVAALTAPPALAWVCIFAAITIEARARAAE